MAIRNTASPAGTGFWAIFMTLPALVLIIGLAACAPTKATRGNYLEDDRLKDLQIGVSTKDEVQQKLGTPTTTDPFDDNTWFYIGEKTSTKAFLDPEVDSRKIVVVKFTPEGLLADASKLDEKDGKEIEAVKKATPAPGREMNAFTQFFSNLGKFNQSGAGGGKGPGR